MVRELDPHATTKGLHGSTKDSHRPQQRSKILCAATKTWCSLILFFKEKKRSFACNGLSARPRPWPRPTLLLLGGTELSFHHLRFLGHLLMAHFDCVSQTLKDLGKVVRTRSRGALNAILRALNLILKAKEATEQRLFVLRLISNRPCPQPLFKISPVFNTFL